MRERGWGRGAGGGWPGRAGRGQGSRRRTEAPIAASVLCPRVLSLPPSPSLLPTCLPKLLSLSLVSTLFTSVGQASARFIDAFSWSLFMSLWTHGLVNLCVDAYCFIFWDLPGNVLAAPASALCGWIGGTLLSLTLSPSLSLSSSPWCPRIALVSANASQGHVCDHVSFVMFFTVTACDSWDVPGDVLVAPEPASWLAGWNRCNLLSTLLTLSLLVSMISWCCVRLVLRWLPVGPYLVWSIQ